MIRSAFTIILIAFAATFAYAGGNETIVIRTKVYCDHCQACESCKPRVDNAIKYVKGVKFSKFNVEEQTITVEYSPKKTSPQKIREAIAKIGFDADDVKADVAAYEKLDGCCKKKE